MTPTSLPAIPVQPNLASYDFTALELFQKFTRESYKAAFGVDAPNWDATKPKKAWFDTSASPGPYKTVQRGNGTTSIVPLVVADPASINLPGLIAYPPYVVAPTQTTRAGVTLNADYMSLRTEADALMAEIGGTKVIDEGASTIFPVIYPVNEPRRLWDVVCGGVGLSAGKLLLQKNANGIGAPGHWTGAGTDNPNWVSDVPKLPDGIHAGVPTSEIPVPLRDLLPNEKIIITLMAALVGRTDIGNQPGPSLDGGSFTDADRAALAKCESDLAVVRGMLERILGISQ